MTDYAPVVSPEEDQESWKQRASLYPPVGEPLGPSLNASAPSAPPPVGSTESLEARADQPHAYAPVEPRTEKPRPEWKDYAPPDPHGWSKFGHVMAAMLPQTDEYFNKRPEKQAEEKYKNATAEFEAPIAEQEKQAETTKYSAEAERDTAQAEKDRAEAKTGPKITPQEGYAKAVQDAQAAGRDPATDPQVKQWADSITSVQKDPAQTAVQNKENFQHGIGVLRGEGLLKPGDIADPKKISAAITNSRQLQDAEKNSMVGYLAANPTPSTSVTVHNEQAAGSAEQKQKTGYYAVDGRIVRGDHLTEEQRGSAMPVKDPEKAEGSIRTTNSTLNAFGRYKKDVDNAKLTPDDLRALQVLTDSTPIAHSFLEKETAGVLDTLFGEPLTGFSNKAMNGIMTKDQYDKLSPDGRKLLVGYFNSLIANFADMKQRLGSIGRNESMIQAEIHTIPLPYLDRSAADEAFSNKLTDVASRNIYYGHENSHQEKPSGGNESPSSKDLGAAPTGKQEGVTGKLPDGTKVVVKGGRLVAQ